MSREQRLEALLRKVIRTGELTRGAHVELEADICAALSQQAEPAPTQSETNDQIAAVMLQHGTPEQQAEAPRYAGVQAPAQDDKWKDAPLAATHANGAGVFLRLNTDGFVSEYYQGSWQRTSKTLTDFNPSYIFARPAQTEQQPIAHVSEETFSSDGTSDIITCNLPIGTALYAAHIAQTAPLNVPGLNDTSRVPDDYRNQASGYRAGWNDCRMAKQATPQTEQQPVAWLYRGTDIGDQLCFTRLDHYWRPKYSSGEHDYVKGIPLYTALST